METCVQQQVDGLEAPDLGAGGIWMRRSGTEAEGSVETGLKIDAVKVELLYRNII